MCVKGRVWVWERAGRSESCELDEKCIKYQCIREFISETVEVGEKLIGT